jgi:protein TonB
VSRDADCRWCRPLAFLISGALHLALIGILIWSGHSGTAKSEVRARFVGVTLAMFADAGGQNAPFRSAPAPIPEPLLSGSRPAAPERETRNEERVAQELAQEPESSTKPTVEPNSEAAFDGDPRPRADPSSEPLPKTAVSARPAAKKEKETEPVPRQKRQQKSKPERPKASGAKPAKPGSKRTAGEEATDRSPGESADGAGGGKGRSGKDSKANAQRYLAALQRAIARHRYYPLEARRRQLEGAATVYFVLLADGRIRDIRITESSGSKLLDKAAVETLTRLGAFEPIPSALGRSEWALRVPIHFSLR